MKEIRPERYYIYAHKTASTTLLVNQTSYYNTLEDLKEAAPKVAFDIGNKVYTGIGIDYIAPGDYPATVDIIKRKENEDYFSFSEDIEKMGYTLPKEVKAAFEELIELIEDYELDNYIPTEVITKTERGLAIVRKDYGDAIIYVVGHLYKSGKDVSSIEEFEDFEEAFKKYKDLQNR